MTKPKPKYTERERDFLDMAAIHIMAQACYEASADTEMLLLVEVAWDTAEALLAERNRRL